VIIVLGLCFCNIFHDLEMHLTRTCKNIQVQQGYNVGFFCKAEQQLAISFRSLCKKVIIKVKHLKAKFYFEET